MMEQNGKSWNIIENNGINNGKQWKIMELMDFELKNHVI